MRFLFLLFVIIPIVEITVLIKVGQIIGLWPTIGLVLLSAFVGVNMLRAQGLSTLARAQQRMQHNEIPGQEMLEGIVLAVGGALLITPGLVTDIMGFSCLIPQVRKALIGAIMKRTTVVTSSSTQNGGFSSYTMEGEFYRRDESSTHSQNSQQGNVLEGEVIEHQNDKK